MFLIYSCNICHLFNYSRYNKHTVVLQIVYKMFRYILIYYYISIYTAKNCNLFTELALINIFIFWPRYMVVLTF